jgi:hypothetical protein
LLRWWSGQSHQTVNLAPYGYPGSNPGLSTNLIFILPYSIIHIMHGKVESGIIYPGDGKIGRMSTPMSKGERLGIGATITFAVLSLIYGLYLTEKPVIDNFANQVHTVMTSDHPELDH